MECKTVIHIDENGDKIYSDKKKYLTLIKAQNAANEQNKIITNFVQRVAYECRECGYFHVGRNGKPLNHPPKKVKEKFKSIQIYKF